LGSRKKLKQEMINDFNQKENNNWIPYAYKVSDHMLLGSPRTLRKLPISCTGPYPINSCVREWLNQSLKRIFFRKSEYP
jgi:hypothetical protein